MDFVRQKRFADVKTSAGGKTWINVCGREDVSRRRLKLENGCHNSDRTLLEPPSPDRNRRHRYLARPDDASFCLSLSPASAKSPLRSHPLDLLPSYHDFAQPLSSPFSQFLRYSTDFSAQPSSPLLCSAAIAAERATSHAYTSAPDASSPAVAVPYLRYVVVAVETATSHKSGHDDSICRWDSNWRQSRTYIQIYLFFSLSISQKDDLFHNLLPPSSPEF
ncbi:hypothetical protein LXL04_000314 [Taraxacum kok-saghyz]